MNLQDACDAVRGGVPFGDVYPRLADPAADGDQLRAVFCREAPRVDRRPKGKPEATGDFCRCGGLMVQTGTCKTCSGCGESSGGCS